MADNLFNRVGNDLSENAITGMLDEAIKGHKKEDEALPIIKMKLPSAESTVKIPVKAEKKKPADSIFKAIGGAEEIKAPAVQMPAIKLPDTLTASQQMRKRYRYRRYGMPIRMSTFKRPVTPMPEITVKDRKKIKFHKFMKSILGFELLLPAVLVFLFFSWFPIIKTFAISLRSFDTINSSVFVGFDNFARIIGDAKFWEAFMHSITLSGIVVLLGTWLPFVLALYVYEMRKGAGLMKILFFIPFLTPAVPAAILWKWMYNQGFGLINSVLSFFTPGQVNIGWLTDPNLALFSIAIVFVWKNTGWALLIYMAGLQNIPRNLFEDASLSGASVGTKIKEIILPALKPVIMAVVFIQIISGMQVFTEVYIMTNGGPQGSSEVIATYIYKKAFLYMDIGYASGVAVFFLLLLVSFSLVKLKIAGKRG
ncbi:MAG TPA: sugar ABC transporter permease [bacterium]|nr:sugar ABC transporter permease [bacterium]